MKLNDAQDMVSEALKTASQNPPVDIRCYISSIVEQTPVYLYGAGAFGNTLLHYLVNHGVNVKGYLDKNAVSEQTLNKLPVHKLDSSDITTIQRSSSLLIVSIVLPVEEQIALCSDLKRLGFARVVDGQSLWIRSFPFSPNVFDADIKNNDWSEKMYRALELLADDESREVYAKNLRAHILREYDDYAASLNCWQYFSKDIPFSKGHSKFVDCGAYNGDTLKELAQNFAVDTYIGFEPMNTLFPCLAETANNLQSKLKQIFLYPCAVGGENRVSFLSGNEGSATLTNSGDNLIQVVRLDDALAGFEPTFIKMDIEGAEIEALQGAEKIIRSHKPDLAICVYHYIRDFFEIPLLLHKFNPNYKIYLRAHCTCTLETTLYATEKERC